MAKKNKSIGFRIFITILKTFITVILMLLMGIASYTFTIKYYEVTEKPKTNNTILDIVSEAKADEISRNIIYSYDAETSKIEAIVIEVLNTKTNNLDYITIPVNTQFSLSNELFRRLYTAEVDIPQIVKLASLRKYIKDDTAYEYGMLILEEHFGFDLGYYTMIPSEEFNKIFAYSEDTGYYKLTDSIISAAGSIEEKRDMESFIKEQSEFFTTNIKIKSKLKYAETYLNIDPQMIYYHVIPGEEKADVFRPDENKAEKLYSMILVDTTHTVKQEEVKVISSEDKRIKVLNGSGGDNIAGTVKGILATEGFVVGKIADSPEIVEKTIIYVREDGMGKDLLKFFNGAIISVGVPDEEFDIVIVVGRADKDIKAFE